VVCSTRPSSQALLGECLKPAARGQKQAAEGKLAQPCLMAGESVCGLCKKGPRIDEAIGHPRRPHARWNFPLLPVPYGARLGISLKSKRRLDGPGAFGGDSVAFRPTALSTPAPGDTIVTPITR
jgi:hypothetical protein